MESASLGKTSFKQRIIGAVVLVSLAVIFLPMLFDEPHSDRVTRVIEVPADPSLPEIRIGAPERPVMTAHDSQEPQEDASSVTMTTADGEPSVAVESVPTVMGEAVDDAQVPDEAAPVPSPTTSAPVVAPAPVATPAAVATPASVETVVAANGPIMLQLGSFGNKENALALRDKAKALGYASHADDVSVGGKSLTRIWVGPYADKAAAETVQPALDKALGLKSRVLTR